MKVTIWDLDYYHAKKKVNVFNPDVMKISSYHKQKGDQVNFVTSEFDIDRPYDLYYIIKENNKTPNAPFRFYVDSKVRWWGKAYKAKINWKMDNVMLGCRPDYLIYPEKETQIERSEHLQLTDNRGNLLPVIQDWGNTFKNKKVIVTDDNLWTTSDEILEKVLKTLGEIKNIVFLKPIWIQKLASNKTILELFLQLDIHRGANLQWIAVPARDFGTVIDTFEIIKNHFTNLNIGVLPIKLWYDEHWEDRTIAYQDFADVKEIIKTAKLRGINIVLRSIKSRFDTPYFLLFEDLNLWTTNAFQISWLEYITKKYGRGDNYFTMVKYWNNIGGWSEVFRDLLRQTWEDEDFLTLQWKNKRISNNDIPWKLWQETFKFGL